MYLFVFFVSLTSFDLDLILTSSVTQIKSVADPRLCVDSKMKGQFDRLDSLGECGYSSQFKFQLTAYKVTPPPCLLGCIHLPYINITIPNTLLLPLCHTREKNRLIFRT